MKVAGHDETVANQAWEELWMAYTYWKKGYTLYSPVESVIYHLYEKDYRPQYLTDLETGP